MMTESKKSTHSQATATQAVSSHMRRQMPRQLEQTPGAHSADVARSSSLTSPKHRNAAILPRLWRSFRRGSQRVEQVPEEDDRSAQDSLNVVLGSHSYCRGHRFQTKQGAAADGELEEQDGIDFSWMDIRGESGRPETDSMGCRNAHDGEIYNPSYSFLHV
jgi:hypothetical protein